MKEYLKMIEEKIKIENNNYGICLIIVNNQTRVKQIQDSIKREMLNRNISVIIPPRIMIYQSAILYLSSELFLKIYNREKTSEYSEEWIELLWYKFAMERINNVEDTNYRENQNIIKLLGNDLKNFVKDITYYCYDLDINNLNINTNNDPLLEDYLEAFKEYINQENNKKINEDHTFYTPLHSYRYFLNNTANIEKNNANLPKIIFIEDYNDLEPIFKKIIVELENKNIIKIEKISKENKDENKKNQIEIIPFINSIDEVEGIVYNVIELLKKNTPAEDFGIVVCNKETEELLNLTFHRYGILLDKKTVLLNSDPYKLLFSTLKIILKSKKIDTKNIYITENDIINIFDNKVSKFYLDEKSNKILGDFISKGKRLNTDIINVLQEIYDKYKEEKLNNFIKIIEEIKEENLIKTITDKTINYEKVNGADLIEKFFSSIMECNNILNEYKYRNDFYEICFDIITLVGKREYKETKFKENNDLEHFIPIITPDKADNITAKTLFICGLDGNFDKQIYSNIPEYIVKKINENIKNQNKLPTSEERILKVYSKLKNAIKNSEKTYLTYSQYDLMNKEKGFSIFLYQYKPEILGEHKKGYEFIPKSQNIDNLQNLNVQCSIEKLFDLKVEDIFKEYQKKKNNNTNEYILEVKNDLATFILCPRQYLFKIIGEVTGIKSPIEKTHYITRGEFWHKLYSEAGKDYRFNSSNSNEIYECLKEKYKNIKNQYHIEEFEKYVKDNMIESIILKRFSENEAKRKKEGYKTLEIESEKELTIQKNNKNFKIKGRIDRIDKINENTCIIDYKITESQKEIKFITKNKLPFEKDFIQISIYIYLLKKLENIQNSLMAGILNIFGEGKISQPFFNKNNCEEQIINLIENSFDKFNEFLSKSIDIKENDNALFFNNNLVDMTYDKIDIENNNTCKYCEYKYLCLSLLSSFR